MEDRETEKSEKTKNRGAEKSENIKNGGQRSRKEWEDKEWRTQERICFLYYLFYNKLLNDGINNEV